MIETTKVLSNSRASFFCKLQTANILIEIIVDFLYRFKDKHPYGTLDFNIRNSEMKAMDVFYILLFNRIQIFMNY